MSLSLNQMNNQSPYSSSTRRSTVHPSPPNLPSIHVLFQLADSPNIPIPIPPPSSLTLPPLLLRQTFHNTGCFSSTSPSTSASSSSSTRASSPQYHDYSRPQKRKQVKRACLNCQKACKGCADTRPCPRCVVHGLAESCVDAPRKSDRKLKTKDQQQTEKPFNRQI